MSLIELLNFWGEQTVNFAWPMLWQSSLLITLLFAFDIAFRRRIRASVRYALWLVVLVKLVVPPSIAMPTSLAWWVRPSAQPATPLKREQPTTFLVSYSDVTPAAAAIPNKPVWVPPPKPSLSPAGRTVLGWAVICAGLLAWLLVRWRQVARDVRRATLASERLSELLADAQNVTGVSRRVELRLTTRAMSPAICGLFRPVILLPQSLIARLSSEQLRAVLLHELIHLRRRDVWINCLQTLLQIFYWWHPLLWLANARIRRVREEAVDDAVMLTLADHSDAYPPTLIEVAKLAFNRPLTSLGLVGILESRSAFRQRIERLMDFHPQRKAGLSIASAFWVLAFAALAVPMEKAPLSARITDTPEPNLSQVVDDVATTNLIHTSEGRRAIVEKLATIRLGVVVYTGATLDSVVRDLNDEARIRDPEGRGINFIINSHVQPTPETQIDPTTGLPLSKSEFRDVRSTPITIDPPLSNLRLVDVLDAIVTGSNNQLKYTIESYAVVFSSKVPELERLYTRTFNLNADNLFKDLQERGVFSTMPSEQQSDMFSHDTRTNRLLEASIAIQSFFNSLGVDLNPLLGKSVFWNERHGMLLVRATMYDLDAIGQALENMLAGSNGATTEQTNRLGDAKSAEVNAATQNNTDGRLLPIPLWLHRLDIAQKTNGNAKLLELSGLSERSLMDYDPTTKISTMRNGGRVKFKGAVLTAESIRVNSEANEITAEGHVRIDRGNEGSGVWFSDPVRIKWDDQVLTVEGSGLISNANTLDVAGTNKPQSSLKTGITETPTNVLSVQSFKMKFYPEAAEERTNASAESLTNESLQGYRLRSFDDNRTQLEDKFSSKVGLLFKVEVREDGSYRTSSAQVDLKQLRARLAQTKEAIADMAVQVESDKKAPMASIVALMNVLKELNIATVTMSTGNNQPTVEPALPPSNAKRNPQIKIEARFVELTQADTQPLGFDWFLGNDLMNGRVFTNLPGQMPPQIYGILNDPQYRVVLRGFEQRSGVDLLSAPQVLTVSGRQAQIQVAHAQNVVTGVNPQALIPPGIALTPKKVGDATLPGVGPDGEYRDPWGHPYIISQDLSYITGGTNAADRLHQINTMRFGPVLDVTPQLSADGYTISLIVTASVTEFLGYAENSNSVSAYINGQRQQVALPLPKFRVRELVASANVWDGQTLVLGNQLEYVTSTKPNGEVEPQEVTGSNKKPLLIFVTVRLVDETGNPIHGNGELRSTTNSIPPQPATAPDHK